MQNSTTTELMSQLKNAKSIDDLNRIVNQNRIAYMPFYKAFNLLMDLNGISIVELIKRTDIDRTYIYQLLNGTKNPGRNKVILLCMGMGCPLELTQQMLTISENSILYAKNPRDAIIIYAISHHFTIEKTNAMLDERGHHILS